MTDHVQLAVADGVARITLDHPPLNLLTPAVTKELSQAARTVEADDDVAVVILASGVPDFFIAHFDVETIRATIGIDRPAPEHLSGFQRLAERFRTMPKLTIAVMDGRVGGGGAELAASMDLRYATPATTISQPEVALGILPGGTGTQRWATLTNRSRAIETILGCDDIDAATAEGWGWLTRMLPADELHPFVDRLATRVAGFPRPAVRRAKQAIDAALTDPSAALRTENALFDACLDDPETAARMDRFLAGGGQTPDGERRLGDLAGELGRRS